MSVAEIRQIAMDLQVVKGSGRFPKGRGHMYMFYKRQGVVRMIGKKTVGIGKHKRSIITPKSRAALTPKGNKMYEQLKGVL